MSQVEVLNYPNEYALRVTAHDSIQPPAPVTTVSQQTAPLHLFPDLPPLYTGHPSLHLRQGIINAGIAVADGEPDAEKAFFVADLSVVYQQHMRWMRELPGVRPFYAVKCNPDPYILRLLASLGAGFDCASNGEIANVLSIAQPGSSHATVNPHESIIFANPCKPTSFIRSAARAGVDYMTFDNTDELHKIARTHPKAKLVVRILTDDSKSLCQLGLKFGAPLATCPQLLATAKQLGLDVVGISFHVGSGCYDVGVYDDALRRARDVWDMAQKEYGYEFDLLDIGGGFEDGTFEHAAGVVRDALERYFPDAMLAPGKTWMDEIDGIHAEEGKKKIRVIAEPGRFYVSRAFKLAASVIARRAPPEGSVASPEKDVDLEDDAEKQEKPSVMYYINDGVYGAFNCILFDHQVVHPYVLSLNNSFYVPPASPEFPYSTCSVWGPTCDSIDCVCPSTRLPSALRVGDWLGFDNMGAYTVCAASQFNGFEVSRVVYTLGCAERGHDVEEVRRAFGRWAGVEV